MLAQRIVRFVAALFLFIPFFSNAQVTSSSITGTIRSGSESLAGATVSAVHLPTGTAFRTVSISGGLYNLVNLIPGGPYTVEVSFVGYQNYKQDNVFLGLGENTRIDVREQQS